MQWMILIVNIKRIYTILLGYNKKQAINKARIY